jgi:hypothetical protein
MTSTLREKRNGPRCTARKLHVTNGERLSTEALLYLGQTYRDGLQARRARTLLTMTDAYLVKFGGVMAE